MIKVVYGDKWLPAVAALQVLCFYGLNRALLGTTEQLYLAAGKPEVRTIADKKAPLHKPFLLSPIQFRHGLKKLLDSSIR